MSVVEKQAAEGGYGEAGRADVEMTIPARFEEVATRERSRQAIGSGNWQATYGELNTAANRLAWMLLSRGVVRGDRVALLMRHDGPQVAAVLGVLKAGGIVVVLNPSDPAVRMRGILADAGARVMVTDEGNRALAEESANKPGEVVLFDAGVGGTADNPKLDTAPADVAFLIYTSGSTGKPKAVMQAHRTILHNIRRLTRGMSLTAADRITLLASLSGGQGVATMWCALLNGAALCPFPTMEKGVTGLAEWLGERGITVYVSAASLFRHFMRTLGEKTIPGVRLVRLGAEPATGEDFAEFRKHFCDPCMLFNSLSSSETGNILQLLLPRSAEVGSGVLPVGYPPEGVEILLLEEPGAEVAAGEAGLITVRGRYLSPGYWGDERQTAERFGGAADATGVRVFKSGDMARRGADGALVFAGRQDARVKIRGYRIELSEIEGALEKRAEVEKAIVCVRGAGEEEDTQLVAYVLLRAGYECTVEALRLGLREVLPGYMVPSGFVFVEAFPLTPHGKIDREKLRLISVRDAGSQTVEQPNPGIETMLADIWCAAFRRKSVGRRNDFFALGGDSLIAALVAARVHAAWGVQLDLRAFSDHPVLADLAAAIGTLRDAGGGAGEVIEPVSRNGPLALSFAQERTWKHACAAKGSGNFNMATVMRITGALDVGVLRESMNYVAGRHEILRATFEEVDGRPVQVVHRAGAVELPVLDLRGLADAEARAAEFFRQEAGRGFELSKGPLLRFFLMRMGEQEWRLIRVNHHIISDSWSWKVYFRELGAVYEAKVRGEPMPLPATERLQYADYAAWQRRVIAPGSAAYRATVIWWRGQFTDGPGETVLPFKRWLRRRGAEPEEGLIWWGLERAVSQRLEVVAREEGATYYMIRLAAFVAQLAEETGRRDVLLGTYVTTRNRVEWQNMFGFFANLVTLRFRYEKGMPFREWLAVVRKVVGEAQGHGEIPYERLGEELRKEGVKVPEVGAIFSVSDHLAPVRFGRLVVEWMERRMEAMPWGFTLTFNQHHEEGRCFAAFDARKYEPGKVRGFLERYKGRLGEVE